MYRNYIIVICIVSNLFFSCRKDYLETPPSQFIVRQQYVTDLSTLSDYLNGCFSEFGWFVNDGYHVLYGDLIADDIKLDVGRTAYLSQYKWVQIARDNGQYTGDPDFPDMNSFWIACYRVIRSSNFVLETLPKYQKENSQKADLMKGQALALRALTHFYLMNVFAQPYIYTSGGSHNGIPYIKSSESNEKIKRNSVAEVYDFMIADWQSALPLLPQAAQPLNSFLITQNAGKAFLSRTYLYKNDYKNANNLAVEVANAVPLMQNGYPAKLFTSNESEALFQLPPSRNGVDGATISTFFVGYRLRSSGGFLATNDISQFLNESATDKRRDWVKLSGSKWTVSKYPSDVVPGFPSPTASHFITLIRSSEMFLTVSESSAKLGDENTARSYLDKIRLRADQNATPTVATGSALLDSIYKERRKEFAFEGRRMFELLRLGKSVNRSDGPSDALNLNFPSNKAIAPLPIFEVSLSGLPQNPDY